MTGTWVSWARRAAAASLVTALTLTGGNAGAATHARGVAPTLTPIKHLVVIFQENVSFDHYFGTYPHAANPPNEPPFVARPGTPSINGLTDTLLTANPNLANPQRLDRADEVVCDQNHDYDPEQRAWDGGLMDRFVQETSGSATGGVTGADCTTPLPDHTTDQATNKLVMDYYDGNTVTALWNYAQHYTLEDNYFGTTFGPSTPGAINLVSGDTSHALVPPGSTAISVTAGMSVSPDIRDGTMISDPDPAFDDCSSSGTAYFTNTNIGDLLNARGITWGWFQGGFRPTSRDANGTAHCDSSHNNISGANERDYSPHHEPFQYYASTANPHHLPPTSVAMIGHTDRANHQYDLSDFAAALSAGNLPAVTFLKAARYQDGHAGNSDPLDEQHFIVTVLNALQASPMWSSTAVIVTYDDSDGFYDHVASPIVNQSSDLPSDRCGTTAPGQPNDRCGYGPRLPLLVISPFAKANYVDHQTTDQTSIMRFIEDNWGLGRIGGRSFDRIAGSLGDALTFGGPPNSRLFLDPASGEPLH
jgi:phospholipase C